MKLVQLIKSTTETFYKKDGILVNGSELSESERLQINIFGESKTIKTETVETRWNVKTNKEANVLFWNYIDDNNLDSRDYFLVITD